MLSELIDLAASLTRHGNTPLPLSLQTCASDATDFFNSGSFSDYRKELEGRNKLVSAQFGRLDNITRAIGAVIKSIGNLQKSTTGQR